MEIAGHLYSRTDHVEAVTSSLDAARRVPLRPDKVAFLNLANDSSTRKEASFIEQQVPIALEKGLSTKLLEKAIAAQVKEHPTVLLAVLGHMEGESFVVLNTRSERILEVPIAWLQEVAGRYGLHLLALGCDSAAVASSGIAAPFNTLEAVKNIRKALTEETVYGFFMSLAHELPLVLEPNLIRSLGGGMELARKPDESRPDAEAMPPLLVARYLPDKAVISLSAPEVSKSPEPPVGNSKGTGIKALTSMLFDVITGLFTLLFLAVCAYDLVAQMWRGLRNRLGRKES